MSTEQTLNASAAKILIVDDEPGIRDGLKSSLEARGFEVETAESGESALYQFRQNPSFSFVVSDYRMPGLSGFDVLKEVKKNSPHTKFVMMTGHGNVNHAVQAMQLGADDYLCKPFEVDALERLILKSTPKAIEQIEEIHFRSSILSQNANFKTLLNKAERAAKSNVPILIEGPSGTGKELLARQIHEWSSRRNKPWVAINCAALPAGLLESELFGYERGAFTGALEKKTGRFEQAHTGTLLLDEIGELDPLLQAKLLRVLQEGEIDRLGGRRAVKVDVRILATTNKNLEQLVEKGLFREDLFFRLYGLRLTLPALRERSDDIPLLVKEFLRRQTRIQSREFVLAEDVMTKLMQNPWQGNIRQLEKAVERAAVLSETGLIEWRHFDMNVVNALGSAAPSATPAFETASTFRTSNAQSAPRKSMRDMEKEIILKTLEEHRGNRTHSAKALGMSLRTLRHKLKQYREFEEASDRHEGPSSTRQETPFLSGRELPSERFDTRLEGAPSALKDGGHFA